MAIKLAQGDINSGKNADVALLWSLNRCYNGKFTDVALHLEPKLVLQREIYGYSIL